MRWQRNCCVHYLNNEKKPYVISTTPITVTSLPHGTILRELSVTWAVKSMAYAQANNARTVSSPIYIGPPKKELLFPQCSEGPGLPSTVLKDTSKHCCFLMNVPQKWKLKYMNHVDAFLMQLEKALDSHVQRIVHCMCFSNVGRWMKLGG